MVVGNILAPSRRLILGVSVALFVAIAGLVLMSIVSSVPVPLFSKTVSNYLRSQQLNYDAVFQSVRAAWNVRDQNVSFRFKEMALFDFGGDPVVAFPELTVFTSVPVLSSRDMSVVAVAISGPHVRIVRTAGGALKIDIGDKTDGSAGTIVRDLLTDLVAHSGQSARRQAPPRLVVKDAKINFEDEITGARFHFDSVDLDLQSDLRGVRSTMDLASELFGETLRISLDGLFHSKDHSFSINAEFSNLNPAILADVLPNLPLLAPIEIALTGRVEAELDRHLGLRSARIDAQGAEGSLELVPYLGRIFQLNRLRIGGAIVVEGDRTSFEDWSAVWPGVELTGSAAILSRAAASSVTDVDLILKDTTWSAFAPRWFSPLSRGFTHLDGGEGQIKDLRQRLVATVSHDADGQIGGQGALLSQNPAAEAVDGAADDGRFSAYQAFGLYIDGTLSAPRVKLVQLVDTDDPQTAHRELCKHLDLFDFPLVRHRATSMAAMFANLPECQGGNDGHTSQTMEESE